MRNFLFYMEEPIPVTLVFIVNVNHQAHHIGIVGHPANKQQRNMVLIGVLRLILQYVGVV
jgi:hypothetical protein